MRSSGGRTVLNPFINDVPAAVPSLFQIPRPLITSDATKIRVPFRFVISPGNEDALPRRMSFTSHVPACVPSVRQSSVPFTPSLAAKYVIFPICKPDDGLDPDEAA